jgi:hypothetical protein
VFALSVDDRELHSSVGIDLAAFNGDDSWELPAAAVFIVDANGIIRCQQEPALTAEQPQHHRRAVDTRFGRATCTTKPPHVKPGLR